MHQPNYYVGKISEKKCVRDLQAHAVECLVRMERSGVEVNVPLAVFDVAVDLGGRRPLELPSDPEAGRLVVVALHPLLREDLLGALAEIERREIPLPRSRLAVPTIRADTPLKRVFNEMVTLPATAVTLTLRDEDGETNLVAFVRTAFTIAELRREIGRLLSEPGQAGDPARN